MDFWKVYSKSWSISLADTNILEKKFGIADFRSSTVKSEYYLLKMFHLLLFMGKLYSQMLKIMHMIIVHM